MSFALLRIPIRVDPFFLLIAVLLGADLVGIPGFLVLWVVIVFASVLLHELGHAVAFRAYGYRPRIDLHGLGGATSANTVGRLPPGRSALITLAGPAVGIVLGGAALLIERSSGPIASDLVRFLLRVVVFVNLGWGVLNLVPILPLDGGRVMAAAVDKLTGGRGEAPSYLISAIVAAALVVPALTYGLPFAAILAGFFGVQNLAAFAALRQRKRDRPLESRLDEAERLLAFDPVAGARRAESVLDEAHSPPTRRRAGAITARAQQALIDAARYDEAAALGAQAYRRVPDPELAFGVAKALGRAGRVQDALAWLNTALEAGFDDVRRLEDDPGLAPLRDEPRFAAFRRRLLDGSRNEDG